MKPILINFSRITLSSINIKEEDKAGKKTLLCYCLEFACQSECLPACLVCLSVCVSPSMSVCLCVSRYVCLSGRTLSGGGQPVKNKIKIKQRRVNVQHTAPEPCGLLWTDSVLLPLPPQKEDPRDGGQKHNEGQSM